ncbi:MAG: FAD-dependent oxidoreductase [Candidatus Levybacteria bacterium]|nr:FAD-dependent oxidoreductase [Candidatus Levybacteria bacterium]MBP9814756.1 FAD-dependent oxidoreductase [Candidatus Levybacteria bacterium]
MNIAIVGSGFTGLSAAYYLSKKGHSVTVFELDTKPGGLAIGYKERAWNWSLEYHYHHWFTNDKSVLALAKEINHKVIVKRPITCSFVENDIYQLDSPLSVLKFPKLNIINRFRMGISLALLRYNPLWKPLERYRAEPYLKKTMGNTAYEMLWKPLMDNKLGKYAKSVSLAWFWARVYKRTPNLAYPEGGFLEFATHLQNVIEKKGGTFHFKTEVTNISSDDDTTIKYITNGKEYIKKFDSIIVTTPSFLFKKIANQLPENYKDSLGKLKGIAAMNLVLRLKNPFFSEGTYWLSMCDIKSPILAIVEHTNFMDKKHYNNEHLVYVGNYMETSDPRFSLNENDLLKLYDPWLSKINPNYGNDVISFKVFRAPFAQPIVPPNYSKLIPSFHTPLKNVYLANIEQVYPWDRGTNYAVELGQKIANLLSSS